MKNDIQLDGIKKVSKICYVAAKILEIIQYPIIVMLIILFGYLPLIRNDTSKMSMALDVGIQGKAVSYLLNHIGGKATVVLLLVLSIIICSFSVIILRRLHSIFKRIADKGDIFSPENIKPAKEAI